MSKNRIQSMEEEETIVNNSFSDYSSSECYNTHPKIILFITEYMSLSLKEKISRYLQNKNIRSIINPITSDTLIHYLCMNDDNYLLIKLINPNSVEKEHKNYLGQTLLHISVQNKSYKIIEYLLENGSNINSKDNKNNTSFHIAVQKCDYNSLNLLLKYNPNESILNIYKETPMAIAKKMKNNELINYLKNYINEKNKFHIKKNKNKNKCNNKNYVENNNIPGKSILNNISINNCSLDTKNETNNQSFNIYKKKIITNSSKFIIEEKIKNNKTINLITSINNNLYYKKNTFKNLHCLSPNLRTKFVYRKTSPKSINNQYTLIEFDDDNEKIEYTPKQKDLSQKAFSKIDNISFINFKSDSTNNSVSDKKINSHYKANKNLDIKAKLRTKNSHIPLLSYEADNNSNTKAKEIRKTIVNKSPFTFYKSKCKNEDLCKKKLLQFLKEIGMSNYSSILISEGFDDIDLILKQMNEGFPALDDTLKEIGIKQAGDRAKILIRLQEISNEFNFHFPFEEVYFKNNGSIKKWLDAEGLSKYNKNFLDVGYQSFELLLIQMASKYKFNENILRNDLLINKEKDINKIMKSLGTNSEKYVKELLKKGNIQRTYSKMVANNKETICMFI